MVFNTIFGGSEEHWPTNAEEVRGFVGSDFCSLKYGRQDQTPDDNDIYTMSAHDLISAIQSWRRFVLGQAPNVGVEPQTTAQQTSE